jgi:hypothetical protein
VFCDSTAFVSKFWKEYDSKTNTAKLGDKYYYPKTKLCSSSERVIEDENVIEIFDPGSESYAEVNPIHIWQNHTDNLSIYTGNGNPLYHYSKGSLKPICKQIIICECTFESDCSPELI